MMIVLSEPAIYHIEITAQCEHHCPGCSNVYSHAKPPVALSAVGWRSILRRIGPGATQIRITGGEPTLHPEFDAILYAATRYNAWVTLSTHGHWRDPEGLVDRLSHTQQLAGLLVSLHGATPTTHEAFNGTPNSFAPTIANIRLAADRDIYVALSTVITHHNWHQIEAIVALAEKIGARQVVFNRYIGPPRPGMEPTIDELTHAISRIEVLQAKAAGVITGYGIGIPQCFVTNHSEGCLAGVAQVAIDPWGNVRPCAFSPTIVGSILEAPMTHIWLGEKMNMWRDLIPAVCARSCDAFSTCHGGCRAIQELRSDGYDPLRRAPLRDFAPQPVTKELPADTRPVADFYLRPESFGYVILGRGYVIPVHAEAEPVIADCDGRHTFADLVTKHGEGALSLLGDLWELGLLYPHKPDSPHWGHIHGAG